MSAPVDVLALLDDQIDGSRHSLPHIPEHLRQQLENSIAEVEGAHAAIAELIEAISAERAVGHRKYSDLAEARKRTEAAIARVKGGAA